MLKFICKSNEERINLKFVIKESKLLVGCLYNNLCFPAF